MTTTEKKNLTSVEIVEHDYFVSQHCRWGYADKSESVLVWYGRPFMVDGSKPYAAQLAPLVRELLENEFFGELSNYGAILDTMTALIGNDATFDIVKCISGRWEHIHREEAKDRAAAWIAGRNILDEIDRIAPDSLYQNFYYACGKDFDRAQDAVLLYGFALGLAAAQKGARAAEPEPIKGTAGA